MNMQADVDKLLEQTSFLLNKQRESRTYCMDEFSSLMSLIEDFQRDTSEDEAGKLENVANILRVQLGKFEKEITQDIEFLEEQVDALTEIKSYDDPKRAQAIVEELLEGKEIADMKEFKKEIETEAMESQESFKGIIDDLREALQEGNIDDLLAYLYDLHEQTEGEDIIGEGEHKKDEDVKVELEFEDDDDEDSSCCGNDDESCCNDDDDDKQCCSSGGVEEMTSSAAWKSQSTSCCGRGGGACGDACTCSDSCGCEEK